MTPTQTLLNHLDDLRDAYRDNPGHPTATARFNQATGANLKANTLKSVVPAILGTIERLNKECQTRIEALQQELDAVRQGELDTPSSNPPKTFRGWSVQTDGRGYSRLYKKAHGKLACVYVGKWDEDKAVAKLEART